MKGSDALQRSRPHSPPSVSVGFPAYNEAATIREVLEEADALLRPSGLDYEILVCDDGSSDQTGAIVDALERQGLPGLRVFHNAPNRGYQYSCERLYAEARKEFVFLNAADRQWPTSCMFDLLPLTSDYDLIVASRKNKHYGRGRAVISSLFNSIPRWLFGVETHDAGAVKLVRREIVQRLPLISRSSFGNAERIIRASRAGYRITHVPVNTRPRETGTASGAKPSQVIGAAVDVPRVWWALLWGR